MKLRTRSCVLPLLLAAGCVDVEEQFVLKTDGSGTVEVKYSVSEQNIQQVKSLAILEKNLLKARGEPLANPTESRYELLFLNPDEKLLRREFEQLKTHGIELEALKIDTREGRRTVRLKVRFSDINRAAQNELFSRYGLLLMRNREGNYILYREPWGRASEEAVKSFSDQKTVRQLTPLLGGFRYELKVRVPGRILDTNAPAKSVYKVVWTFAFDDDPSAVLAFQTRKLSVVFEGVGLKLPDGPRRKTTTQPEERRPAI